MASSCDLGVRITDLQETIKNQTKLAETQANVIEDQRRIIEKHVADIDDLRKTLALLVTGKRTADVMLLI